MSFSHVYQIYTPMRIWQARKHFLLAEESQFVDSLLMAEVIKLRVKCHACSNLIEGSAKYGGGHYVPEGVNFEFVAIGKVETPKGRRVKAEITADCPNCGVRCKWTI